MAHQEPVGGKPITGEHRVEPFSVPFFESYEWCLNPYPTVVEQLDRLEWEVGRGDLLESGWESDERAINAWLLACGIACTADDYLARHFIDLAGLVERFPPAGMAIRGINAIHSIVLAFRDWRDRTWRRRWKQCEDQACQLLIASGPERSAVWNGLRQTVEKLRSHRPSRRLDRRRARLPEGFRCQDLAHQDILEMARRFASREPDRSRDVLVVGMRTAGGYFAPLIGGYLETHWSGNVSWISIRPKHGLGRRERRVLSRAGRTGSHVVVTDDHPNSGKTHRLVLTILQHCGVAPTAITVLSPRHPVNPEYRLPSDAPGAKEVTFITIEPEEVRKASLLEQDIVEAWFREWLGKRGWSSVRVRRSAEVNRFNAAMEEHLGDGFQVRIKRVFELEGACVDGRQMAMRVIGKGVGWGWMGYHAYFATTRLDGFVPTFIGLREGLLFSEWVDDVQRVPHVPPRVAPSEIAQYVARRTNELRVPDFAPLNADSDVWSSWDNLIRTLSRVYDPSAWRLKRRVLRRELGHFMGSRPTLLDGRMRADEWVLTSNGVRKLDFEQHNFGAPEANLVDPAYDLAAAAFEFALDPVAEHQMMEDYRVATGDKWIEDRMLLHKILVGTSEMQNAANRAPRERQANGEQWNRRHVAARDFLVHTVHRVMARRRGESPESRYNDTLLLLNLDGVVDSNILGFPHTTLEATAALDLLQRFGFCVVPNTGRSVEHVRFYCGTYCFAAGIAEHGSVIVDALHEREVPLITPNGVQALQRCRESLRQRPGIFIDPTYYHSVRAYRYAGDHTIGLETAEISDLLKGDGLEALTSIATPADTYFVQAGVDKGAGIKKVRELLDAPDAEVLAIGHSDPDIPMFKLADAWYAPASCSAEVRTLARSGKGRIMPGTRQRGLLQAVREVVHDRFTGRLDIPPVRPPRPIRSAEDLLIHLFHAAERSRVASLKAALDPRYL